ncbi:hypothetical protein EVY37_26245, partial [Klebsiella pneumoniae]|uniref:hypothetical protein n=1 Tax=Klebsiella pneumoniae TaxID=573 RepID=UPI00101BCC4F
TWRSKLQQQKTSSERENELAAENARLKRQLAERDRRSADRPDTIYAVQHPECAVSGGTVSGRV